jgi:hypothetical protein
MLFYRLWLEALEDRVVLTSAPFPVAVNLSPAGPISVTAGTMINFRVSVNPDPGHPPPDINGAVRLDTDNGSSSPPAATSVHWDETSPTYVDFSPTFDVVGRHYVSGYFYGSSYLSCAGDDNYQDRSSFPPTQVDVDPGDGAAFYLDTPRQARAGRPFSFRLFALDRFGNVATGYQGMVHFTSSDSAAALPMDYTFTPADRGTHAFTATLFALGTQTITATDTADASITGSSNIEVVRAGAGMIDHSNGFSNHGDLQANGTASFADAARLADGNFGEAASIFTTARLSVAGPFTTTFWFQMRPGTNPIADGLTFTLQNDVRGPAALGGSGGALGYGPESGNPNEPIVNSLAIKFDAYKPSGNHSSTGLYVDGHRPNNFPDIQPGDQYVDLANTGIDFNAAAQSNPPHTFRVSLSYADTTLTEIITDLTTATSFSHAYAVNIPQVIGSNAAYVGFTAGTGGLTSVQDILSWTGDFDPASIPPATQFGTALRYYRSVAGEPVNVIVSALDADGNPVPGYRGTVHLTSSDPQAVLPPDYTFTPADRGSHAFQVIPRTAGVQTITIQSTADLPIAGTVSLPIRAAAPQMLVVSDFPSPVTAGDIGSFTVTAYDRYGNVANDYADTVTFSSSDAEATLPADFTFSADDGGSHTFQAILRTAGIQSITVTDTRLPGISGTQDDIVVNPSDAAASFMLAERELFSAGAAFPFIGNERQKLDRLFAMAAWD